LRNSAVVFVAESYPQQGSNKIVTQ